MKQNIQKSLISLLIVSLLTACSGDENDAESKSTRENTENSVKKFKGQLSKELRKAPSKHKAISDIGDIDQILAFAIKDGKADLDKTKSVPVDNEGKFELEFDGNTDKDTDWTMMMSNSNAATPEERLGNYISISEGDIGLTSVPMGIALNDIDVGLLTKKDDETTSQNSISDLSDNFVYNGIELLTLAALDSATKGAKNLYLNYDSASEIYWNGMLTYNYSGVDGYNKFSNINSYENHYSGWAIEMLTNRYEYSEIPKLCNGDYNIKLIPPSIILSKDNIENSTENPFDNKDLAVYENGYTCWNKTNKFGFIADYDKVLHVGIFTTYQDDVPEGYWKVTQSDETVALFDFAVGSIFDKNGNYQVLMPSVKFTVDSSYKITKISIKWYRYDYSVKQYVELSNKNLIKKLVAGARFSITDFDGIDQFPNTRIGDSIELIDPSNDIFKTEISEFKYDWYVTGNKDTSKLTVDNVKFNIGASHYLQIAFNYEF